MPIRSLGNPSVRYNAVMSKTGNPQNVDAGTAATYTGAGDATRGLFAGHYPDSNIIDYITIASAGNASDFGDLTKDPQQAVSCASPTRGIV